MKALAVVLALPLAASAAVAPFTVTFTAPVAGTYPIWHRVIAPDANSDSWFVSVDGGTPFIDDNCEGYWPCDGTFWTPLTNRTVQGIPDGTKRQPYSLTLAAGQTVSLAFTFRDSNTQLVQVFFGDPFATPTPTPTLNPTRTPTVASTSTPTVTPTRTSTPTPISTSTVTPTRTPTFTPTTTPTSTRTPTPSGPFQFYSVTPCRAFTSAPSSFSLKGVCGVPATAKTILVSVTVSAPTMDGSYTLDTFPVLQFLAGETQTSIAVVKPDLTPSFSAGTGQVAIDVYGYFQ